jgi:membrane-associated phospholipid phosphatase
MRHTLKTLPLAVRLAPPVAFSAVTIVGALRSGLPAASDRLLVWLIAGLICFSVGDLPRAGRRLLREWLPFVAIVLAYNFLRGHADELLPHAHAEPQVWFSKLIGGGTLPVVWLQQHLWHGVDDLRWYDYATWVVYTSHFFVTPVLAAVLWLRSARMFRRYCSMVALLAFSGLVTYVLFPTVPPWLASRDRLIPHTMRLVDPISAHLPVVNFGPLFQTGRSYADDVAALPSLHAAYALLAALLLAGCARRRLLRAALMLYPLAMAFALVYSGEHYTLDIVLGWVYAYAVYKGGGALLARLEDSDKRHARDHERHPARTAGVHVVLVEADPAVLVDEQRRQRLARDDERDQRRRAEPGSGHDRAGDVERSEQPAEPDPPGRAAEPRARRQRPPDERGEDEQRDGSHRERDEGGADRRLQPVC